MRPFLSLILGLVVVMSAEGRFYAPRVVSPHNADAYSLQTFARFPRWRDLKGDARAWEMYRYLADTRTGLFHFHEVREGTDRMPEFNNVRDPIKIINVYGYGYCGILGPLMEGVCESAGVGNARTVTLPGWKHVVAETYYDKKWHYLDVDVRAVFRRPDGSLASLAEARKDASLWTGRGPLFFPNDDLSQVRKIYQTTRLEHYHNFYMRGHTMDYVLRQGETFTRWWTPQGGRWNHRDEYNREAFVRQLIEQEPRGPIPNHRAFSIHNHGNGRFVYQPNLTRGSSDFDDGVYDTANVEPGKDGLRLKKAGSGYAIFEVGTPYIIVPLVGKLETTEDDREASVVQLDASNARLWISLDKGLTWKELPSKGQTHDLTREVSGTYGYLLKIGLHGKPDEAVVHSLKITTWVQVAPASLPSLRQGKNRFEFRTGDHYGLPTRVVSILSDTSNPERVTKYLLEPAKDYDPNRRISRIHGSVVAQIAAPPGSKIVWFSAGGSFQTHQLAGARHTRNNMAYAVDKPDDFKPLYRAAVPPDTEHWHYNIEREVKLERPAQRVYVRYVGDPAVNNFRLYAHCVDDRPHPSKEVRIKHVWSEAGQEKSKTIRLGKPGSYEVVTGAEARDVSIEMAVPSERGK